MGTGSVLPVRFDRTSLVVEEILSAAPRLASQASEAELSLCPVCHFLLYVDQVWSYSHHVYAGPNVVI